MITKAAIFESLGIVGLAMIVVGFAQAWPPLGWIAAGTSLLIIAATRDLGPRNGRRRQRTGG